MTDTATQSAKNPEVKADTASTDNQAVFALQSFASDLHSAAALIEKSEFSKNGLGPAGNAFRAVLISSEDRLEEAFSEILYIGTSLFEAGHLEAAKIFLESARLGLVVPRLFQERLDALISGIDDVIIMTKVEKEFYQGDEDTAFALAEKIKSPKRAELLKGMRDEASRRKKTRGIAFGLAGAAILGTIAMTVWGAAQAIETFKNPPQFALEPFEIPQQHLDLFHRAGKGVVDTVDRITAASGAVVTEMSAMEAKDTPGAAQAANTSADEPRAFNPSAIDPNTLYSCALGHGVLQKLSEINVTEANLAAVSSIEATYVEVCLGLGLSEEQLNLLSAEIDNVKIDNIVDGLTRR